VRGHVVSGNTNVLWLRGSNGDSQNWLCVCNEDRRIAVAPAATVGLALSESAGSSRLPGTSCSSVQPGLPLLPVQAVAVESTECLAKSKPKSHYDWWSVSPYVLVSSPSWNLGPDIAYYLKVAVLSLWGALSDERSSLSFVSISL
jgi:hypothetical protein